MNARLVNDLASLIALHHPNVTAAEFQEAAQVAALALFDDAAEMIDATALAAAFASACAEPAADAPQQSP